MPQLNGSIGLMNSATQVVTYTPIGIDNKGVARLADLSAPSLETQSTLSVSAKRPVAGGSQVFRLNVKLSKPTIISDPVTGTVKNGGDNFVNVEFVFNKQSSIVTAQDLLAELSSYLSESQFKTMVETKVGYF